MEKTGAVTEITLDIVIPLVARIAFGSTEEFDKRIGRKFFAALKATSLHFFN